MGRFVGASRALPLMAVPAGQVAVTDRGEAELVDVAVTTW
jgi:hypothetical protein